MFKQNRNLFFICLLFSYACDSDQISDSTTSVSYNQPDRPQLHYSAPAQWTGMPMNSIFFEGEYHLFYHQKPPSAPSKHSNWGHAVSTDLTHWTELAKVFPDNGNHDFSPGSVLIDWENTSGFSRDGEPPLLAFYSYSSSKTDHSIAVAYSNDRGRSWKMNETNSILTNTGPSKMDHPKILWDGESNQWLMLLSAEDRIVFYGSKNLTNWNYLSDFGKTKGRHGGRWSCPEMFQISIPASGYRKWVLLTGIDKESPNGGSGVQYFIGEFDGKRFKLGQEFAPFLRTSAGKEKAVWLDYGRDFQAAFNWSDLEGNNERCLMMGWMNNGDYATSLPTSPWQGNMTFPRVLELRGTVIGPRIFQSFAQELQNLRKEKVNVSLRGAFQGELDLACVPEQLEIILEAGVAQDTTTIVGFELSNDEGDLYTFGFDAKANNYFSDRTKCGKNGFSKKFAQNVHIAPKQLDGSLISMHVLIDATSCELIADDGLTVMTEQFFPTEPFTKIVFYTKGLSIDVQRLDVYELEQIWEE